MASGEGRTLADLAGRWIYSVDAKDEGLAQKYFDPGADRSSWKATEVPSNWYLTEVGQHDGVVWFQREFDVPTQMRGRKLSLRFRAVDYIARVWLNGTYLGSHEGYFTPFEFEVTDAVRDKGNVLVVRVDSPRDPTPYIPIPGAQHASNPLSPEMRAHQPEALTIVKGHLIDAMHKPGAKTMYRQDGNTGGIWQTVQLIARGPVQIAYAKIYCRIVERDFQPDGSALVTADLELENRTGEIVDIEAGLRVTPENFDEKLDLRRLRKLELQPGLNVFKLVLTIPEVRLWWTWDHGNPNLYRAELWVERDGSRDDAVKQVFGVKHVRHDDESGHWYLNGQKVFLRGMRYFSSMYMSESKRPRIEKDLKDMHDMAINSIRIGSHVELEDFYDLCDRMGFLVWQNFPFHYCVSDSDELIERAGIMMRDMVRMLHNHVSIGMWSVFKEPQVYSLPDMPNNYGRLCEVLYETAKTVDPIRWMHKGDYQEGVQNLTIGGVRPADTDLKAVRMEPNIVEFGSQALPPLKSLKKIIPEKDLWPPNWDTWEYWCFYYDIAVNRAKINVAVNSLEELIEQSQSLEAKILKEQIEFFRQHKYRPIGSMYLYYWNDPAPTIGSGIVDYFGEKLPAYYSMKSVYTPVLVSLEWNKRPYVIGFDKFWKPGDLFMGKVWVTNDHHRDIPARLRWELVKEGGAAVSSNEVDLVLPADAAKPIDTVTWSIPRSADVPGSYLVKMHVTEKGGKTLSENSFDFKIG